MWNERFRRIAQAASQGLGSPWTFLTILLLVIAWGATGRFFGYSAEWQISMSTGATIVTLLAVCLLQNAQIRDTRALHLKLDELIRSSRGARNNVMHLESATDAKVEEISESLKTRGEEIGTAPMDPLDREQKEEPRASAR
jgi:low affinity Fe/Cu permease